MQMFPQNNSPFGTILSWLHPGLVTAQCDCVCFQEMQTDQSVFPLYRRMILYATRPFLQWWQQALEGGVAMWDEGIDKWFNVCQTLVRAHMPWAVSPHFDSWLTGPFVACHSPGLFPPYPVFSEVVKGLKCSQKSFKNSSARPSYKQIKNGLVKYEWHNFSFNYFQ